MVRAILFHERRVVGDVESDAGGSRGACIIVRRDWCGAAVCAPAAGCIVLQAAADRHMITLVLAFIHMCTHSRIHSVPRNNTCQRLTMRVHGSWRCQ